MTRANPNKIGLVVFLSGLILTAQPRVPTYRDYPAPEIFTGVPAAAILASAQQQRFRTRIREGVSNGSGVWNGSWKDPIKSSGPNFAGHYYVIRWGCGSNCLMMAVVDAQSGRVYSPPLGGKGDEELYVPMDPLGDHEIDFQRDSSLMVLRNACKESRRECGVYYFNWQDDHFALIRRTLVDLTKVN